MTIGINFGEELRIAGLDGCVATWGDDGSINYAEGVTAEQVTAVEAVLAAHDPVAGLMVLKARAERDRLLCIADIEINKLEDTGQDASALRSERQSLRDVPQQPGFPNNIIWPVLIK